MFLIFLKCQIHPSNSFYESFVQFKFMRENYTYIVIVIVYDG